MARSKDHDSALWHAAMRDVRPMAGRKATAPTPAVLPGKKNKSVAAALAPSHPLPGVLAAVEISHGRAGGIDRRSAIRLRRGRLPIEATLDLHGLTQRAAFDRLCDFIAGAESAGKRCVLVITGKGLSSGGALRDQVPRRLNLAPNRARVLAFDYARQHHGGAGALYVLLKRRRNP